jgi:hypothetical protein
MPARRSDLLIALFFFLRHTPAHLKNNFFASGNTEAKIPLLKGVIQ